MGQVDSKTTIRVMGPPALETPERLPLKHHKVAVLLAYLAVHGSASRERLTGLFWPELPQQKASTNLRGALHKLKALAPGSVETEGDQIALSSDWSVDLIQLQNAATHKERRRAARYQGIVCEGISLPDCDELEGWLFQLREDTHCQAVTNLIELSRQWVEYGDFDQAVEAARTAVSIEAHSEPAHAQLIESLLESGDRAAAERQFQRLTEVLQEEYGTEPREETARLLERVSRPLELHNLPSALTSFFGRDSELAWIATALEKHRCVTVTGMGGVGKTQLCLEACRRVMETEPPPDGIWLLRLAPLQDGSLLREVFEQTISLPSGRARFWSNLQQAHTLLLVDNCEHLLEPCAELLREILETCPGVRVLATSREPLHLPGEQTHLLEPLPLPRETDDLEHLLRSPSVQLLLERGKAVAPDLQVTPENAEAFVQICRGLDGIPLAIELAGARLGMLSPEQLALRLTDRFSMLKGRPGDEARQKTLGALLDWSYETLDPELKTLLASLSVFAGNFDLCAVEDVCLPQESKWEALERLSALVEKSLVTTVPSGRVKRYKLLETVRQYARGYLSKEDLDGLMDAHMAYYLKVARRAEVALSGSEQKPWLKRLDNELANMRAAVRRAEGRPHRIADSLELCLALVRYWVVRDLRTAVRKLLPAALAEARQADLDPILLVRAHRLLGEFATDQGDLDEGRDRIEESLRLALEIDDSLGQAHAHKALGNLEYCRGDFDRAATSHQTALELFQRCQDSEGVTDCENNLGLVAFEKGEYEESRRRLSLSMEMARNSQDLHSVALSLTNLGHLSLREGKVDEAEREFSEALRCYRQLREYWSPTLESVKGLCRIAVLKKQWEKSVILLVLAAKLARRTRMTEFVSKRATLEQLESEVTPHEPEGLRDELKGVEADKLFSRLGF